MKIHANKENHTDDFEFIESEASRRSAQEAARINIPESSFLTSLEKLCADDIAPAKAKGGKRAPRGARRAACLAVMLVSLLVLAWGIYTVIMSARGYADGDRLYSELSEFFNSATDKELGEPDSTDRSSPAGVKTPASLSLHDAVSLGGGKEITINGDASELQYKAKLDYLKKINPDIYGWIKIEGTDVDYPIVRGEDNSYYLNHAYTGEYMIVGSIFADYRTDDSIINNYNTVLYGHNMENGSMFHAVEEIKNDEKLFDSARIVIYTPDGIYTYAPISVYETNSREQYFRMRFMSVKEFTDFAEGILEKSVFPRTAEFTENDRILTLSTCTNGELTGRFALHARLIDVEQAGE